MKHSLPASTGAVLLLAAASLSPVACSSPAAPRTPEAIVKRMSDRLASAQAFSFSTHERHQRRRGGKVVDVERSRDFVVKRPGAIAFKNAGGLLGEASGAYDGKSFTMVWPGQKAWARVHMPDTIDATLDRLAEHFNAALPVGDLLYSNPHDALVSADSTGQYVGTEKVDGADCDHVAYTQARVDWDLWVAAQGEPTPCRIRITTKGRSGPLTSDVTFSGWNLAIAPAAGAFETQVPADYERIRVAAYDTSPEPSPAAAPAEPAPSAKP